MVREDRQGELISKSTSAPSSFLCRNPEDTEELVRVKHEMAELYRSKCQNDQQLIDANQKIAELDKKTSIAAAEFSYRHSQRKRAFFQERSNGSELKDFVRKVC